MASLTARMCACRARWLSAPLVTVELVDGSLARLHDQLWAVEQVVQGSRCALGADTQRHLLAHLLHTTTRMCQLLAQEGSPSRKNSYGSAGGDGLQRGASAGAGGGSGGYDGAEARTWRRMRVVLLRHLDRLNLLLALHQG